MKSALRIAAFAAFIALPVVASAQPAAGLRYAWKPGESYVYTIRIEADLGEFVEELSGTITWVVKAADANSMTLSHRGTLQSRQRAKDGRPMRIVGRSRLRFNSPFGGVGLGGLRNQSEVKIDPSGKVLTSSGQSQLPFMLGELLMFVVDPLSPDGKNAWDTRRDLSIIEVDDSRPVSRLRQPETIKRAAVEQVNYSLGETTGSVVRINKKYDLRTADVINGAPRLQQAGDGFILFDKAEGAPQSMEIKFTISQSETNATVRVPVTASYKRLDAAEVAKLQEAAEKAAAQAQANATAAAEAKAAAPPASDADLDKALAELKNKSLRKAAAERLTTMKVNEARQAEIARALEPLLDSDDQFVSVSGAKALAVWGVKDSIPALVKALEDENVFLRDEVLAALGKLPDDAAAEACVKYLRVQSARGAASKALKDMGPTAEKDVLGALKDPDWTVRAEACDILGVIGGKSSIAPLQERAKNTKDGLVATKAKSALSEIGNRAGGAGAPGGGPVAKPSGTKQIQLGAAGKVGEVAITGGSLVFAKKTAAVGFGTLERPGQKPQFSYFAIIKSSFGVAGASTRFSNRSSTRNNRFTGTYFAQMNASALEIVHTVEAAGKAAVRSETLQIGGQSFQPAAGRVFLVDLTAQPPRIVQKNAPLPAELERMAGTQGNVEALANKTLANLVAADADIKEFVEDAAR